MCGIAGILRFAGAPPARDEILRMTEAIAHRGPDASGLLLDGTVALGHRRLSIIDLEGGAQPMTLDEGRLALTYNGEIYNFQGLRAELEARGRVFATRSDTEVVLHAYDVWGPACVDRFRGMFAFGLVDRAQRRLLLARDPFGIKPLYVRRGDAYVAFASELVALRQVDDAVPAGDLQAIENYLRHLYVPAPQTIYRDIEKVPAATWLTVDFDGRVSEPTRYWSLEFDPAPDDARSDEAWVDAAEDVIRGSVEAHLVADVPFGVFLSGGVDSTLVAGAMSRLLDRPVKAFAIGFEDEAFSELRYAGEAARDLGIELVTEVVTENALDMLPWLSTQYGEPFADSSAIPTWHVAKLARAEVPMVLSGDGGDELFGGYEIYRRWMGLFSTAQVTRPLPREPGRAWKVLRRAVKETLEGRRRRTLNAWMRRNQATSRKIRRALWPPDQAYRVDAPCPPIVEAWERTTGIDRLACAQAMDLAAYLPGDILTKVDIASMSHGLEVRPPLIDREVASFAATLPLGQRLAVDAGGHTVGKAVLKRLLGRYHGAAFVHRSKQGFAVPMAAWFRGDGRCRTMLEALVDPKGGRLLELFDPGAVRAVLEEHQTSKDRSSALWALLVLGLWMDANPGVSFS